jgi:hypothetical protein
VAVQNIKLQKDAPHSSTPTPQPQAHVPCPCAKAHRKGVCVAVALSGTSCTGVRSGREANPKTSLWSAHVYSLSGQRDQGKKGGVVFTDETPSGSKRGARVCWGRARYVIRRSSTRSKFNFGSGTSGFGASLLPRPIRTPRSSARSQRRAPALCNGVLGDAGEPWELQDDIDSFAPYIRRRVGAVLGVVVLLHIPGLASVSKQLRCEGRSASL